MNLLISILEQGLIYAVIAIGVYITYKILDFPDMSVDGTFPLGAAVAAVILEKGANPFLACVVAVLAGCAGGLITGFLHVKLKISNLMAGILVMIGLYSINLRIMDKSNIPLFGVKTLFSGNTEPIIIVAAFALVVKIMLDLFLKTKTGFMLRAVGDNEQLVTSLGVNKDNYKILGLMISNGLAALAGALMAQYQGYADVGMGTGTVVIGLAAVIMGESIFGKISLLKATTTAALGSIIYKAAIALALKLGLPPNDLKLITAIIVIIALSLNTNKLQFKFLKKKAGGEALVANSKSVKGI